ncbi:hypothetical protein QE428_000624 [Microbacterium sp. SORGH_AS 505]|uniref:hypothetical protein n=1 Tax=Microbacterium sp. SORGH_AS_0505 TaxID=3041770 RepID=UPI00278A9AB1|nr:hypothetical protein [Microbacterium sp. SORGH_AS_0505]MDQ1125591.1 hypothetical protein [Microbacterium sp. SORGH_AS_0505]
MVWHTEHPSWRSGPWSLELRGDELADIAAHGKVVLRSIRAVVRDADWNTADLVLDRVRSTDVTLTLHVRSEGLGSSFSGVVRVEARPAGLRVLLDLEAGAAFDTNRTGLVVLHPPSLAGVPAEVRHPDGTGERTAFPRGISPHQPMREIAGLRWEVPGATVDVAFDGDVFEMEDQRNWTDASYKTYSRPLDLPFPYRVEAGERVRQSVAIEVAGEPAAPEADEGDVLTLRDGGRFPQILLGAGTAPDPAPTVVPVGDGLVVELDLGTPTWPAALARAAASAVPLDVRVVLGDDADALDAAAEALRGLDVLRVAAFQPGGDARHVSDAPATAALRAALDHAGIRPPVAGGSRSHFTELNRERHRLPDDLDGILTTVTPLFHATGTEQLVESVAVQRLVATQAVGYADGTPVHIGPVSLRPRFNNVATGPQPAPTRGNLSEGYGAEFTGATDTRQSAPELAAWTVASAAALAVPGVASLAFFEEWGPRGIRASDGTDLPVASALRELAAGSGGALLWGDSPDGLVWAIGHRRGRRTTLLVANLDRAARSLFLSVDGVEDGIDLAPGTFRTIER